MKRKKRTPAFGSEGTEKVSSCEQVNDGKDSKSSRNNQNPDDILMLIAAFSLLGLIALALMSEGGAI